MTPVRQLAKTVRQFIALAAVEAFTYCRHNPMLTDICLEHMLLCMRTTLNIDNELMKNVKRKAAEAGRTITEVIEEAIRESLYPNRKEAKRFRLRWVTVKGRLRPGVDLTDRDALYERMEGRE